MKDELVQSIASITGLEPEEVSKLVVKPKQTKQGDFAFPWDSFPGGSRRDARPPRLGRADL